MTRRLLASAAIAGLLALAVRVYVEDRRNWREYQASNLAANRWPV